MAPRIDFIRVEDPAMIVDWLEELMSQPDLYVYLITLKIISWKDKLFAFVVVENETPELKATQSMPDERNMSSIYEMLENEELYE